MKEWSEFLPYIRPFIDNCGDIVMEEAVKRTCIKFCESTKIYRLDATVVSEVADQSEYDLTFTDPNVLLIGIWHATRLECDLRETSEYKLDTSVYNWRQETGTPAFYYLTDQNKLRLYVTPDEAVTDSIQCECIVRPTLDSTEIPDYIKNQWAEVIAEGALAYLKKMPMKPWTDFNNAAIHEMEYRRGMSQAKKYIMKNRGVQSTYVSPQDFSGSIVWD